MTTIDAERFRIILEEERRRVVAAISYLHEENPGSIVDETEEIAGSDNHLAETATVTLDREIDYTLEENSEHVLGEIDGALRRIAEGSFGRCGTCDGLIPEERLEALPWATECIDCRRREERA